MLQTVEDVPEQSEEQRNEETQPEQQSTEELQAEEQQGAEESQPEETQAAEADSSAVREIPESYIVQKGDTLLGISRKIYGGDEELDAICALNGIDDSDRILAGQKLLLP